MNKFLAGLFITVFILILPVSSQAKIREGSFEINPFAGYCTGATTRVLCHKDFFGFRAGYTLTKNWEIEGAFDYVNSGAEMFHAGVLYNFMPDNESFHPFLVGSIGEAHVRPRNSESYTTLMADIGVGFKYFLNDTVAIRTDFRDVMTHFHNAVLTAGFTFAFGGKTPKAAAPAHAPEPTPEPRSEPGPAPTPKPEPLPPAPEPVKTAEPPQAPRVVKVVLEDVHFEHNKASLTPLAKEILEKNIEVLKENPGVVVTIEGHTSSIGSASYNMKLSVRRADAVKLFLVSRGISPDRLTTVGYGETRLAMPEATPKKRNSEAVKMNRRVHFEIIVK